MRSLLIAPLPPPVSGNSLPVVVVKEILESLGNVDTIDLKRSLHGSGFTATRLMEIWPSIKRIALEKKCFDLGYLTLAESNAGNLRDIAIYSLLNRHLHKLVVHMFGGANMRSLLGKRYSLRSLVNHIFLKRLGAIVVEGPTQAEMFMPIIGREKVHVINNFAEKQLFITDADLSSKFSNSNRVRILFLSNMLEGKGHIELVQAYKMLPSEVKALVQLDIAGKLVSRSEEFLSLVEGEEGLVYHGPAYGEQREALFRDSHIFCLPTYYKYEGQPFSIIEAYASACCVVTTNHSGIPDIFQCGRNGLSVQPQSPDDLRDNLLRLINSKDLITRFAIHNVEQARQRHSRSVFVKSFRDVVASIRTV